MQANSTTASTQLSTSGSVTVAVDLARSARIGFERLKARITTDDNFRRGFRSGQAPKDRTRQWVADNGPKVRNLFTSRADEFSVRRSIKLLIGSMKTDKGNSDPEAMIDGFLIALTDLSEVALIEAVSQCVRGEASYLEDGGQRRKIHPTFLPTPAELRLVALGIEAGALNAVAGLERLMKLPVLAEASSSPESDEHRKAVAARWRDMRAAEERVEVVGKDWAAPKHSFEEHMASTKADIEALFEGGYQVSESLANTSLMRSGVPTKADVEAHREMGRA